MSQCDIFLSFFQITSDSQEYDLVGKVIVITFLTFQMTHELTQTSKFQPSKIRTKEKVKKIDLSFPKKIYKAYHIYK